MIDDPTAGPYHPIAGRDWPSEDAGGLNPGEGKGRQSERSRGPNKAARRACAESPLLLVVVPMKLAGKARPKIYKNGGRGYPAAHVAFEAACVALARAQWGRRPQITEPVDLYVVAWFRRPQRLAKARKWWGDGPRICTSKPDYDNALGLPMDALVKAGVLRDDTLVANHDRAPLQRWYVPVGANGAQGRERVVIALCPHTPVEPYLWSLE